jgi:glycosyltransferase involved in cell wall biosynthesis
MIPPTLTTRQQKRPHPAPLAELSQIDLTLFIACYNEQANIIATLETVAAALREVGDSYEMIVIDDASTDGSAELIRAYQEAHPELPLVLHVNRVNRGLARNFVAAALLGRGEHYKLVCGDNVESRATLVRILRQRGQADLVLPYHDHCEGKSAFRMFLSRAFTRLVNLVSGRSIRYYNGLPLCRRDHVLRWHSDATGFGFQADLVSRLLDEGASYVEVHCQARERAHGTSRALTVANFLSVARTLLVIGGRRLRRVVRGRQPVQKPGFLEKPGF